MTDKELLELAAKAAGACLHPEDMLSHSYGNWGRDTTCMACGKDPADARFNPLSSERDRYQLARQLGLTIDFTDCSVFKRLSDHSVVQEYWGDECGDEAHAIVRAAAEVGKAG